MKKIALLLLAFAIAAFADIKLDFQVSVARKGCSLVKWEEDYYDDYVKYKRYAIVECNGPQNMPVNMVGLKFLNLNLSTKGKYWYYYGEK